MSSTTSSGSSQTASPSPSTSSSPSIFSASGTPAFILAFLAIGLFVGGMLAMFALRRRLISRGVRAWFSSDLSVDPGAGNERTKRKKDFGKRPELWDIYAREKCVKDGMWKEVMPISAKFIPSYTSEQPQEFLPPVEQHRNLWLPQRLDALKFFHRSPTTSVPQIAIPSRPSHLEITVAVSMPIHKHSESDQFDFTFGSAKIPLKDEFMDFANGQLEGKEVEGQ
ncbi:uncharacterized protein FIBRA_02674 [Fibroporia radiculosa]|uniref:Uncharacterized protein n=1 Tax=Fibroporia radiculosa TaxID=599839 RepID=J4HVA9_9APHY|nr:uncharacterized protein FIBRA_02674 [Fibroporia radiculosa]CCM00637.1 predicted protein [Fibroporia radiculosa]